MTIEHTDVIDFISTNKDRNEVKLTISDHYDWGNSDSHLFILQEKINTYINFIESGELLDAYAEAKNLTPVINIIGRYPLNQDASDFLEKVNVIVKSIGIEVRFSLVEEKEQNNVLR